MGIILFVFANHIAVNIFNEPMLSLPLKIFSICIPVFNLIIIIVSIYRGFNQLKPLVYFHQILQNLLFLLSFICLIVFKLSFIYVFYFYLFVLIITCISLVIYSINQSPKFDLLSNDNIKLLQAKPLLIFSIPLLVASLLQRSTGWTNILMIGGIKTAVDVGLYTTALAVTSFITFPIGVMLIIYMPVVSNLYGSNKINEIKRIFSVITKWLCFVTIPIFVIIFIFPEFVINFIYGSNYVLAENALRILSIGAIFNIFSGPNAATLIAIGKPRFIMYATLSSAIICIGLNIILIPPYGIVGAAIAATISIISINIIKCIMLYHSIGAHPLSKNMIKPTILITLLTGLLFIIFKDLAYVRSWLLIPLIIGIYIIYYAFFVITKSVDVEDKSMIRMIIKKIPFKKRLK